MADHETYEGYLEHTRQRQRSFWRRVAQALVLVGLAVIAALTAVVAQELQTGVFLCSVLLMAAVAAGVVRWWARQRWQLPTREQWTQAKAAMANYQAVVRERNAYADMSGQILDILAKHHAFKLPLSSMAEVHRMIGFVESMQQASYPELQDVDASLFDLARQSAGLELGRIAVTA